MNVNLKKKIKTYYLTKTLSKKEELALVSQNSGNCNKYITKELFRNVFKKNIDVTKIKFPLFLAKNNKKFSNFNILKKEHIIFTKKEDLKIFHANPLKLVRKYNNLLCSVINLLKLIKFQAQQKGPTIKCKTKQVAE